MKSSLRLRAVGTALGLLQVFGLVSCSSGPAELSKVIPPQSLTAYQAHLEAQGGVGRDAYFHWRAKETGQSVASLASQDQTLSQVENPFRSDDARAVGRGAIVYLVHCANCHGPAANGYADDGSRLPGRKNFHNSHVRMIASMSDSYVAKWFRKIHDGSASEQLDEHSQPRVMPAMKGELANEQIWLAITYLKSSDTIEQAVGK